MSKQSLTHLTGDYHNLCIVLALEQTKDNGFDIIYSDKVNETEVAHNCPGWFVDKHKLGMIKKFSLNLAEITFKNLG